MKIFYDTKTIIIHLMKELQTCVLPIDNLRICMVFICHKLNELGKLDEYDILFDPDFESIKKTVIYNSSIFSMNNYHDIILNNPDQIDTLAEEYNIDEEMKKIIHELKKLLFICD